MAEHFIAAINDTQLETQIKVATQQLSSITLADVVRNVITLEAIMRGSTTDNQRTTQARHAAFDEAPPPTMGPNFDQCVALS